MAQKDFSGSHLPLWVRWLAWASIIILSILLGFLWSSYQKSGTLLFS